jgi:hypothetical protein
MSRVQLVGPVANIANPAIIRSKSSHQESNPASTSPLLRPKSATHRQCVPVKLGRSGRSVQLGRASAPTISQARADHARAEGGHGHVVRPAVDGEHHVAMAEPAAHRERAHGLRPHFAQGRGDQGCARAGSYPVVGLEGRVGGDPDHNVRDGLREDHLLEHCPRRDGKRFDAGHHQVHDHRAVAWPKTPGPTSTIPVNAVGSQTAPTRRGPCPAYMPRCSVPWKFPSSG